MNLRTILSMAALVAVGACSEKTADVTVINGTAAEGIEEVRVNVQSQTDTLVPVTDGRFTLTLPTDVTLYGRISAGDKGVNFIPDGTALEVIIDEESTVVSKSPKISVQERLNAYNADEQALMDKYMDSQKEIYSDSLLTQDEKTARFEAFYNDFIGPYLAHHTEACRANSDNFISVLALSNLRGELEDAELEPLINSLARPLQENRYVKNMKEALSARLETAEGKPFKDFTVSTVVGQTRSIPPQPKYQEVKFSDYVGNGKYVLVDFWSPWCGPCRREMPNIKKVYDKYKGDRFDVLSIAVWERQPVEVTIETAAKLNMDWNQINNAQSIPTGIYGIEGIPHVMLIGPDGTILRRGLHGAGIEEAVAEYLE